MRRILLVLTLLTACGGDDAKTLPYEKLSDYGLFEGNGASQTPVAGVVAYEVIAPLFSDFTSKHRFIALPEGGVIEYSADGDWIYPVGTMLVKTFAYPIDARDPSLGERLLETRILRLEETGWTGHTYEWNAEQTDATLNSGGARIAVSWIDAAGVTQTIDYRVPNRSQCRSCHGEIGATRLLGPRTRQLNRDNDYGAGPVNQIDHLMSLGMLAGAVPPVADRATLPDYRDTTVPIEARARSYMEANCAHCHGPNSPAESSGLILTWETTSPVDLGVCRMPFSAGGGTGGRLYDIVPGLPDESVMVFRVESTDPAVKMPEMPTQLADPMGIEIIREWITSMSPAGCP